MRILAVGDVVGKNGQEFLFRYLASMRGPSGIDFVIANGENASDGNGLSPSDADEMHYRGVDVITSGNHIWQRREIHDYLDDRGHIVRPGNYPDENPGRGMTAIGGVAVINLIGTAFMDPLDNPFRAADRLLAKVPESVNVVLVDFHAEATSEKIAMGHYLDGRVSAVLGTHTHVQTSDEGILPGGTAYITDLGMTGPYDSVLGIEKGPVIARFLTRMPSRYQNADGPCELCGMIIDIDSGSGRAISVERIRVR